MVVKEVTNVAETVSAEKYYLPGENYAGMCGRIANFIACAEVNNELRLISAHRFYDLMIRKAGIPGGRILVNAGAYFETLNDEQKAFLGSFYKEFPKENIRGGQMMNCFVLPLEDSKHGPAGIYQTLEDDADLTTFEGGVGTNFSKIRPKGAPVRGNPKYTASGPVSFLKVFNCNAEELRQSGGRRGAHLGLLQCDHPDIFEWIDCKRNDESIKNYNLSVGILDSFMRAVENNSDWDLKWNGVLFRTIKARELFDKLIDSAWKNGDPGVIFLDTVRSKWWKKVENINICCNACSEIFEEPYEACDLMSLNLAHYIYFNADNEWEFNYTKFKEDIHTGIRFLDNVIDLNNHPLKYRDNICEKVAQNNRRLGLGLMGAADALMMCGIPYDSEAAIVWTDNIGSFFKIEADCASRILANERGVFPSSCEAISDKFIGRRNCATTAIAPNGTISMIAGCNGGWEPFFGLVMKKNTTDGSGNVYYMVPDSLVKLFERNNIELNEARRKEIFDNGGSVNGLSWVPADLQACCKTALEISPMAHVEMQCTLQKHIENAISKTINFRNDATREDFAKAIFALWHGGAKSSALYRDGSRDFQILNVGNKKSEVKISETSDTNEPSRPEILTGKTTKVVTHLTHGVENAYITCNEKNGKPFEVFFNSSSDLSTESLYEFLMNNKVSHDVSQMICSKINQLSKESVNVTTRLVSLALRNNVPVQSIIKQLQRINMSDIHSFHRKLAHVLSGYVANGTDAGSCPVIVGGKICGGRLVFQEGCVHCSSCGDSKCD